MARKSCWSALLVWVALSLAACQAVSPRLPAPTLTLPAPTFTITSTATPQPSPTLTFTPTFTPLPSFTPTPTPIPFYEPAGCKKPSDDYAITTVNGLTVDKRTAEMLVYAKTLYGGEIDITKYAVTQGSFTNDEPASFGTHAGGGAVDLSVRKLGGDGAILWNDILPLVRALRTAGFAAWLRDPSRGDPGTALHIHAIAIGDKNLSPAAADQLTGPSGYFRGLNGVPASEGGPAVDPHGGPIICQWMLDAGYKDLRPAGFTNTAQYPPADWQERLRLAGQTYLTNSPAASDAVARKLDFLAGNGESASTMCGPLAAALLRDAGLLPLIGPATNLHNFWLADPRTTDRPWSYFPPGDYTLYSYKTPAAEFDFKAWPLRPGDFVYTFAPTGDGYDHMFTVTEVDSAGRAFTVTNQVQPGLTYLIQRLLLYDPADPSAGVFKNDWVNNPKLGRTGVGGFAVMRRNGITLPAGSLYPAPVQPGDTLPELALRYHSTVGAILNADLLTSPQRLWVGQKVLVPVNVNP